MTREKRSFNRLIFHTDGNLLIAPCNTFIAYATMFRPEGFASHTLNAKGLTIQSSFGCKILDNLLFYLNQLVVKEEGEITDFNSSSLDGLGHVPGSSVTARKKL